MESKIVLDNLRKEIAALVSQYTEEAYKPKD
jgi:hypothetical protein